MAQVNMLEAKTNLSKLVEAIESGAESEIVLARNGKPVALVVPAKNPRRLGLAQGMYGDFSLEELNALNDEVAKLFYGDDPPQAKGEPTK
jgi:antitoxin (DNA-binding transcriptional repressor) of toxin-antitoxin stability system